MRWQCTKVPVILQGEIADCALACLAMVLWYWNWRTDLARLRSRFPPSVTGTSLRKLKWMATQYGLRSTVYRLGIPEIRTLRVPLIAFCDQNHFVVITRLTAHTITMNDPRYGRESIPYEAFEKRFSGFAMELIPGTQFRTGDDRLVSWRYPLKGIATLLVPKLAQVLGLTIALESCSLLLPFFSQLIIDRYVVNNAATLLYALTAGFAGLVVIRGLITLLRARVTIALSKTVAYRITNEVLVHLLNLPFSFFARRHGGDISSRINASESIRNPLTTHVVELTVDVLMFGGTIAVMFWYSVLLASVTVYATVSVAVVSILLLPAQLRTVNKLLIHSAEEEASVLDTTRNIQSVKVFGCESRRVGDWARQALIRLKDQTELDICGSWEEAFASVCFGLATVFTVTLAVGKVKEHAITIGMVFAFLAYQVQATTFSGNVLRGVTRLLRVKSYLERIGETLCEEATPRRQAAEDLRQSVCRGSIRAERLGFRFSAEEPWIFRDLELRVDGGQRIAIVGPTGIGKSTLISTMLGLLVPTEGTCVVDDVLVTAVPKGVIAAVTQADRVLKGTIAENVSFFDEEVDVARLSSCLEQVGLAGYVSKLPLKHFTIIGDHCSLLSAGQRQLLLVARALYVTPCVLILDEATSNLDLETEARLLERLSDLPLTQIVVTHRLESVRNRYAVLDFAKLQKAGNASSRQHGAVERVAV